MCPRRPGRGEPGGFVYVVVRCTIWLAIARPRLHAPWLLQFGGPGFVAPVARREGVGGVGLGRARGSASALGGKILDIDTIRGVV